jgi:chaperonin cofactor prefoldin
MFFLEFQKYVLQRQQLDGQLIENKNVLEELNLLKDDNSVRIFQA